MPQASRGLVWHRIASFTREAQDEQGVLACCEEGLRHGGLGSAVGEIGRLTMTNSRRLQLAAESFDTLGIASAPPEAERGAKCA